MNEIRFSRPSGIRIVLPLFAALLFVASNAEAKEEGRSVTASMGGGSGAGVGIRAQPSPGPFTVPEGYVATGFKYHFQDGNFTSTRLGPSNIYSVTEGRYIREAEGNPSVVLQPGKYKFVVGGKPGAQGSLSFRLVSTTEDEKPDNTPPGNTKLPTNFDVTYSPLDDIYFTDKNGRKRLRDVEGIEVMKFPAKVVVQFRGGKVTSRFSTTVTVQNPKSYTTTNVMEGQLTGDRFTGTDTTDTRYIYEYEGSSHSYQLGDKWTLSGQVQPNGLLVIHHKWKSDFGNLPYWEGKTLTSRPHKSGPEVQNLRIETHLRLPVGKSQDPRTPINDNDISGPPASNGGEQPPVQGGSDIPDVPKDSIWNDDNDPTVPADDPGKPPVSNDDNIWNTDDTPDDPIADDDGKTKGSDNNIWQNDPEDDFDPDKDSDADSDADSDDGDGPKPGDRLPDGRILFKPPWDKGDAYPTDEKEVQYIRDKQRQGYRWSDRNGWVDDERQKDIDEIKQIQRRNDEKERKRTGNILRELSESEKRAKDLAGKAKSKSQDDVDSNAKPAKDAVDWEAGEDEDKE